MAGIGQGRDQESSKGFIPYYYREEDTGDGSKCYWDGKPKACFYS